MHLHAKCVLLFHASLYIWYTHANCSAQSTTGNLGPSDPFHPALQVDLGHEGAHRFSFESFKSPSLAGVDRLLVASRLRSLNMQCACFSCQMCVAIVLLLGPDKCHKK